MISAFQTVTNVAGRKVAQLGTGIKREMDRIQIEEKVVFSAFKLDILFLSLL